MFVRLVLWCESKHGPRSLPPLPPSLLSVLDSSLPSLFAVVYLTTPYPTTTATTSISSCLFRSRSWQAASRLRCLCSTNKTPQSQHHHTSSSSSSFSHDGLQHLPFQPTGQLSSSSSSSYGQPWVRIASSRAGTTCSSLSWPSSLCLPSSPARAYGFTMYVAPPSPTRLSPRPVGRVPLVLVPRRSPLILRRCREEGGGGWSCVWLWWVQ